MEKVGERIWVHAQSLKLATVDVGTRMTVMQLNGHELLLYSPVRLTPELKVELDKLGKVTHIIAPNGMHHLFVKDYLRAYSQAKFYGMAELAKKRPDLDPMIQLGGLTSEYFGPDVVLMCMLGSKIFNEAIIYHKPSRSLLVTDIAFNLQSLAKWHERFLARLYGAYQKFGPSILARKILRKHPGAKKTLRQAMAYDFQRVIPCHGEILAKDAKDVFIKSFRFILV